jgi:hypothetical protein
MKEIVFSNRRITSRFPLIIKGKVIISDKIKEIDESECEITNISYEGIQMIFKNNKFLFLYLNCLDDKELKIKIEIEYDEEKYVFENFVKWVRINDIGERNFYVLTALGFSDSEIIDKKEKKLDLLTAIYMENIFIGNPV